MTIISLPYCASCGKMYECKENEIILDLGHAQVMADLYECPTCGHQIVMGYAKDWLPHHLFEQIKNDHTIIKADG